LARSGALGFSARKEYRMSFMKILAPLTGGPRDAAVLTGAFAAAKSFGSHVVALFVRPDPTEAMPFFGEGVSGPVLQEIVDVAKEVTDKAVSAAKATLDSAVASAGVELVAAPMLGRGVTVSWREVQGNFADRLAEESRLSDLVVLGPLGEGDRPVRMEAFEAVLLDSGRPVLLVTQTPSASLGKRIAIGCDGSVASAHAVTASLPFLYAADSVELFTIRRADHEAGVCGEVRNYLALHGVSCSERTIDAGDRPVGDAILHGAAECRPDLLVLGGYAHSRLRQTFFGSVTKHVISRADVPLFLVH
jgi:nucleotide-binding universal stress UspA family protein